jgi:hypothetical protein
MPRHSSMSQSHAHHYVPQWYQRRFLLAGQTEYYCRDLQPGSYTRGATTHPFKEVHKWGTKKCFFEEDLYQLKLGSWASDEIERFFFGQADDRGRDAVALVADYDGTVSKEFGDAARDVITYMGAQRFRTQGSGPNQEAGRLRPQRDLAADDGHVSDVHDGMDRMRVGDSTRKAEPHEVHRDGRAGHLLQPLDVSK